MFKNTFPFFPQMQCKNSVVSTQIMPKIYRAPLKAYHSSVLAKTSENCFYIVNLYFPCTFAMRFYFTVRLPLFGYNEHLCLAPVLLALLGITFQLFKLLCLAKDH